MAEKVTREDLEKLPTRAIVAFAARCARRVQPLYKLPDDAPDRQKHEEAIERAIQVAEQFARGELPDANAGGDARAAAKAAAKAANANAAYAAGSAARAAYAAARAAYATDYAAARAADAADAARADNDAARRIMDQIHGTDLKTLRRLKLGGAVLLGQPVDPSESGPLGPLWPAGEPEWLRKSQAEPDLANRVKAADPEPMISVYFDESGLTDEDIELFLSYLSEVYRERRGVGLKVVGGKTLTPEPVGVWE